MLFGECDLVVGELDSVVVGDFIVIQCVVYWCLE